MAMSEIKLCREVPPAGGQLGNIQGEGEELTKDLDTGGVTAYVFVRA